MGTSAPHLGFQVNAILKLAVEPSVAMQTPARAVNWTANSDGDLVRRRAAPFPKGYALEQGDWSLLDPVRARGRIWRGVPGSASA